MNNEKQPQTHLRSWEWWFLLILSISALTLRFIYLSEVRENPFFDHPRLDALFHDIWAQSIASGEILGDKVFFRAPVYPYFLAGLYAIFGHNYLVPRIAQHLLGVIGLLLLYFLSRRVFGARVAVFASILASLYTMLIYFEGELLFDSLLTVTCLLWLVMCEKGKERPSLAHWFVVGVVYGIICCIRPVFLAITPFVFAVLCWPHFKAGAKGATRQVIVGLTFGCLLPIFLVTIRNYVVGNDFVLIASQGGLNFYIGNNPAGDGYTPMMPGPRGGSWENRDLLYIAEKTLGHTPSPSEESWFWYKKGFDFILSSPNQYVALLLKKVYLFWNWFEIPNNQNFYSFRKYSPLLQILPIGFWFVGPIGILGMLISLQQRRGRFHVAFILLYSFVIILFFVCDRFRLPIVPPVCMFAGYALHTSLEKVRLKQWGWMAAAMIWGACIAIFVNSNLYEIDKDSNARDNMSLGIVELDKGNPSGAISYFSEAAKNAAIPRPNLYLDWGAAEWEAGHASNAIEKFHQELHFHPDANVALSNLSYIYLSEGNCDSAIYFGRKALEAKPYLPKPYITVAQAYQKQNHPEEAVLILEEGARSCSENFLNGRLLLAGLYNAIGRSEAAKKTYHDVITQGNRLRQPSYEPERDYVTQDLMERDDKGSVAMALYGLGHVCVGQMQLDSAVSYFGHAVRESPGYADAWADLGVAYMRIQQYANADSALGTAIKLQPENHIYWFNYATALGTQGRLTDAQTAFKRALSIRPDFAPAQRSIALTEELLREKNTRKNH